MRVSKSNISQFLEHECARTHSAPMLNLICMVNRVRLRFWFVFGIGFDCGFGTFILFLFRFECSTFVHSISSPTFPDGSFMVHHHPAICRCGRFERSVRASSFPFLCIILFFNSLYLLTQSLRRCSSVCLCLCAWICFVERQLYTRWSNVRIAMLSKWNEDDSNNDDDDEAARAI